MSQLEWSRLERRVAAMTRRTIQAYVANSPHYRGEVPTHLHRHMSDSCRAFGRLCIRTAREDRRPRDDELQLFRERGRDRGNEGLPVTELIEAYLLFTEELWNEVTLLTDGHPPTDAANRLLHSLRHVLHAAVQAHQEEYQAAHSEARETLRATVRALASGEPPAELAARVGLRLADAYAIVALRIAPHPSESIGDALGRRIAGRRKVQQLTEHLNRLLGDDVLTALDPDGGLLLLPSTPGHADDDLASIRAAIPRLADLMDVALTAGFAHAPDLTAIPAGAAQAQRLLELAARPGHVAALADHLFEYQLHHDTEAVPHLRAIIDRLRDEPELLTTLATYFSTDFNRRQSARELHVHPNTVDNRLGRVAALTGADPHTSAGVLLLGAALEITGSASLTAVRRPGTGSGVRAIPASL